MIDDAALLGSGAGSIRHDPGVQKCGHCMVGHQYQGGGWLGLC
jgi:hypothetical protein